MSDETRVYEIDLTKKYILRFPGKLILAAIDRIKQALEEWIQNDQPFLVIDEDVKLVRVETEDEQLDEVPTHPTSG